MITIGLLVLALLVGAGGVCWDGLHSVPSQQTAPPERDPGQADRR